MGFPPMQLFAGLNVWAILLAAAAAFIFGGVWYGALSQAWMQAANLTEEIQLLGPIKLKTVEEAQASIVRVIRTLEESGQIDMSRGGDELVV